MKRIFLLAFALLIVLSCGCTKRPAQGPASGPDVAKPDADEKVEVPTEPAPAAEPTVASVPEPGPEPGPALTPAPEPVPAKPERPPIRDFTIKPVPAKGVKSEWDTFDILVWQFKTQVEDHHDLWERAGCRGFHIDRSGDRHDAEWAQKMIFYQDHAAGKGYLYLYKRECNDMDSGYGTRVKLYSRGGWVAPRPRALSDASVIKRMQDEFRKNVGAHTGSKRMLIAFDDEISLGKFASPHEVCGHPNSVAEFQQYLRWKYDDDIAALNKQWGTDDPRIFVVIGEKCQFPGDSVHQFLQTKYGAQYKAFKARHGDLEPEVLRLRGDKMASDVPGFAYFEPYGDFDEIPAVSYEWVRKTKRDPLKEWNLSSWADFRDYMDHQFAKALRDLTLLGNELDPDCPCGYVGGQAPNAWGGHNYSLVKNVIQWIEAYDIGATNEILWGLNPDILRVQTYFPPKDWKLCSWVMTYYAAHQNKCFIMWPASGENSVWTEPGKTGWDGVDERLKQVAPYTKTLIEEPSRQILAGKRITDPIALYYSQPSIRAVWAMDSDCHGTTWPARSSSLDNFSNSWHQTVISWTKVLEDLGYQYIVVDEEQLHQGRLDKENTKVLIMPKAVALSQKEIAAVKAFADAGGTVIADNMPGLFDQHARGLSDDAMPACKLFGVTRDSSKKLFDGSEVCELNGETGYGHKGEYDILLAVHKNARKYKSIPVAENGLRAPDAETAEGAAVMVVQDVGKGKTILMNLSVLSYIDMKTRVEGIGGQIREVVGAMLAGAGLKPEVLVYEGLNVCPATECLMFERKDGSRLLAVIKNPVRHGTITGLGSIPGISDHEIDVEIRFEHRVRNVKDIMTGANVPISASGASVRMKWKPWEMLLLSFDK